MKAWLVSICCLCLGACKAPEFYYQSHRHGNISFFRQLLGTLPNSSKKIDSIQVYEATLQGALVSRNNVGERTVVNTESNQEVLPFPTSTYEHRLYIFRFFTERPLDDEVVFMQTTFRGNCFEPGDDLAGFDSVNCKNMGIGPAYYGVLRSKQLNMTHRLVMNKRRDRYVPVESEPQRMRFMLREPMMIRVPQHIFIDELLVLDANKIGGSKPLRYQLTQLFSDSSALKFRYTSTITNSNL